MAHIPLRTAALGLLLCAVASGSQTVCLKTGFCLNAQSLIQNGDMMRLEMGTGEIELRNSEIASIEAAPSPTTVAVPVIAKASAVEDAKHLVNQAAAAQGLDPDFVGSVAAIESAFQRNAFSAKGAVGIMQLTLPTARDLHVDPYLVAENALGGAKYLRALLLKYHSNSALALAAYNAGPGAVSRFGGVPPYSETLKYIQEVTREYDRRHLADRSKRGRRKLSQADSVHLAAQ